jgi:sugar lactone lactonase YvrE
MPFETRREFLKHSLTAPLLVKLTRSEASVQDDDEKYRPTPDGVIATQSRLYGPAGLSLDSAGNLYVADQLHYRIRCIDAGSRTITTVAGTGVRGFEGDGGPATSAKIDCPTHVFVDRQGNVFFSEYIKDRVRRVDARSGIITTVAGNDLGKWGDGIFDPRSKEGDVATRRGLDRPDGIGADSQGNLIISDSIRILRIDKNTQRMTTLTGNTTGTGPLPFPSDLTVDHQDNIHFAELNTGRIRVFRSAKKTTETIYQKTPGETIRCPVLDGAGNLFFIQSNRVFRMELPSKRVTHFAGKIRTNPTGNFSGDGGPATAAGMDNPSGLAIDVQGNIYLSDWIANRIRRIDRKTGIIETIAGNGEPKHPPRPIL